MREYEINELKNGMRVVSCRMDGMESAAVGVFVGIGGRFEDERIHGISHFVEHLLFKGTKKRTSMQISKAIEGVGGHINAYTSEEHTCYMVKVRGKHQELALEVLMDMIKSPLFDSKEIEKERYVIKEEIHMIVDNPGHYASEVVHQLMWPDHPLGRMLIGTEESINSISRDDILEFQKNTYFPKNMIVSAAGNIDVKKLVHDSEALGAKMANYGKPRTEIFESRQKEPVVKICGKQTEQIHVCLGMRSVPREDPDRYVVKLLSIILGENMSSRLFQTIREKHGLSYEVNSGVSYFKDSGGFVISSGVKPDKLNKYCDLVAKELRSIKKNSVKSEELNRAKEFYEGQIALGFEKTMSRMLWMGENMISTESVPTVKEVLEKVKKVKIEDIRRLAAKIFNKDNLSVAVIGPAKEGMKLEFDL